MDGLKASPFGNRHRGLGIITLVYYGMMFEPRSESPRAEQGGGGLHSSADGLLHSDLCQDYTTGRMDDKPKILELPIEILQRIAFLVGRPVPVRFQPTPDRTELLHFRLTCKAFEKASFDVLVDRFPRKLLCCVNVPRNIQSLKAQVSQTRLTSRLTQVTLSIDILGGSLVDDIKTVETTKQNIEDAQILEYRRFETDFYRGDDISTTNQDLASALQQLQMVATPPAIKISVWLSEDIYLKHQESRNIAPRISAVMNAVPAQMLRDLQLAYVHCDPDSLLPLLKRSTSTLEDFTMDNVSFVSSTPRWTKVLEELDKCSNLKYLFLCNLREECLGAELHTRQRSSYSPFSGYFHAGFSGRERVVEGLKSLIAADLCVGEYVNDDEEIDYETET